MLQNRASARFFCFGMALCATLPDWSGKMRPTMDDLSHLFEERMAFGAVVNAGGFDAAGARFGVPSSRLSRSVTARDVPAKTLH